MPEPWIAVVLFVLVLVASWFYVGQARHPDQKPVAAYLIFVVAFSVTIAVVYGLLFTLIASIGAVGNLSLAIAVALGAVAAFLIGRSLIRRPPRPTPRI